MDIRLNPDDLTLGDLEDFEAVTGKYFDEIVKPVPVLDENGNRTFDEKGRPVMTVRLPVKALVALVWITRRKVDPSFTLEDARNVRVNTLILDVTSESRGNA